LAFTGKIYFRILGLGLGLGLGPVALALALHVSGLGFDLGLLALALTPLALLTSLQCCFDIVAAWCGRGFTWTNLTLDFTSVTFSAKLAVFYKNVHLRKIPKVNDFLRISTHLGSL